MSVVGTAVRTTITEAWPSLNGDGREEMGRRINGKGEGKGGEEGGETGCVCKINFKKSFK